MLEVLMFPVAKAIKVSVNTTGGAVALPSTQHSFVIYSVGCDTHFRTGASLADASTVVDFTDDSDAADPVAFNGFPVVVHKMSYDDDTIAYKSDSGSGTLYILPCQAAGANR